MDHWQFVKGMKALAEEMEELQNHVLVVEMEKQAACTNLSEALAAYAAYQSTVAKERELITALKNEFNTLLVKTKGIEAENTLLKESVQFSQHQIDRQKDEFSVQKKAYTVQIAGHKKHAYEAHIAAIKRLKVPGSKAVECKPNTFVAEKETPSPAVEKSTSQQPGNPNSKSAKTMHEDSISALDQKKSLRSESTKMKPSKIALKITEPSAVPSSSAKKVLLSAPAPTVARSQSQQSDIPTSVVGDAKTTRAEPRPFVETVPDLILQNQSLRAESFETKPTKGAPKVSKGLASSATAKVSVSAPSAEQEPVSEATADKQPATTKAVLAKSPETKVLVPAPAPSSVKEPSPPAKTHKESATSKSFGLPSPPNAKALRPASAASVVTEPTPSVAAAKDPTLGSKSTAGSSSKASGPQTSLKAIYLKICKEASAKIPATTDPASKSTNSEATGAPPNSSETAVLAAIPKVDMKSTAGAVGKVSNGGSESASTRSELQPPPASTGPGSPSSGTKTNISNAAGPSRKRTSAALEQPSVNTTAENADRPGTSSVPWSSKPLPKAETKKREIPIAPPPPTHPFNGVLMNGMICSTGSLATGPQQVSAAPTFMPPSTSGASASLQEMDVDRTVPASELEENRTGGGTQQKVPQNVDQAYPFFSPWDSLRSEMQEFQQQQQHSLSSAQFASHVAAHQNSLGARLGTPLSGMHATSKFDALFGTHIPPQQPSAAQFASQRENPFDARFGSQTTLQSPFAAAGLGHPPFPNNADDMNFEPTSSSSDTALAPTPMSVDEMDASLARFASIETIGMVIVQPGDACRDRLDDRFGRSACGAGLREHVAYARMPGGGVVPKAREGPEVEMDDESSVPQRAFSTGYASDQNTWRGFTPVPRVRLRPPSTSSLSEYFDSIYAKAAQRERSKPSHPSPSPSSSGGDACTTMTTSPTSQGSSGIKFTDFWPLKESPAEPENQSFDCSKGLKSRTFDDSYMHKPKKSHPRQQPQPESSRPPLYPTTRVDSHTENSQPLHPTAGLNDVGEGSSSGTRATFRSGFDLIGVRVCKTPKRPRGKTEKSEESHADDGDSEDNGSSEGDDLERLIVKRRRDKRVPDVSSILKRWCAEIVGEESNTPDHDRKGDDSSGGEGLQVAKRRCRSDAEGE
ncbi:hypothetical protein HDU97_008832 [Phlyctochytrium planicorne]|nr:hypothetical protein HDU97_008832 [Phlyctochytrium planicorne]